MNTGISKIEMFQVDLPLAEGRYSWSGGNFVVVFDSTVVAVSTEAGLVGYSEVCPLDLRTFRPSPRGLEQPLQRSRPN